MESSYAEWQLPDRLLAGQLTLAARADTLEALGGQDAKHVLLRDFWRTAALQGE